jgi:hypothetical protein
MRLQVFLDEAGADVDVELDQGGVACSFEAVDFAGFDDEDVSGTTLEGLAVDGPSSAALSDELNLVVRMAMRARSGTRFAVKKEDGYSGIPLLRSDKFVRTSYERQILLAYVMHAWHSF